MKALYRRALGADEDGGGRVTEICARPLINLFYPELAGFAQPLSGEAAGRRDLLSSVPFFSGYAVELGLLIDLSRRAGLGALAQVDLGARRHANQPTAALGAMASTITQAVLRRLADEGRAPEALLAAPAPTPARCPGRRPGASHVDTRPGERPPMARARAAAASLSRRGRRVQSPPEGRAGRGQVLLGSCQGVGQGPQLPADRQRRGEARPAHRARPERDLAAQGHAGDAARPQAAATATGASR